MNPCRRRTTTRQRRAVAPVLMVALATAVVGSLVVAALRHAETPARRTASGQGYWIVARDGGLFALGDSAYHGSPTASEVAYDHIVGMAATRDGEGYWVAAADGSVFTYGNAHTMGAGISGYNRPVVGIEATPSGSGYWLVAADGGVFAFGDAVYQGSTAGLDLNQDIVGLASTPSGRGYWLVGADGGVFAFGDAVYQGSAGGISLNQPVRGIASTRNGQGYWLVAADGGIFAYGDAGFEGSTAGRTLRAEIVGIARTPASHGYWLAGRDGGIFAFGDAAFLGPDQDLDLRGPAVGVAALRNTGPGLNVASGPSQDGFTTDTTPAYAGSASDPGGSVDKVEASVDGGPFSTSGVACIACGSPFSAWDFETPELPEGLHTIRLRPVDDMGAAGDVVVRRVTVDTTDPTIGFSLAPPASVPFRQPRPTIGGNAADVPGGVDRIEVSVDDGSFSTDGVSCNDCPGTDVAWSYTPPAPLDDGENTVSFRAVDRAENTSSELDSMFEVDVTVPVLLSIASTSASPVVTATFSEPVTCSTVSAADFSVTKNGAPDPVAAVGCTPPSDPTIELTLTEPPAKGEPLQVTPTDTVADPAGNPVPTVPVSTTVVSANPPVAAADSYSTDEDTTLTLAAPGVLGNDTDADLEPITAVLGTGPAHGSLTLGADGSLSYAPAADFDGSDSFTYTANDGTADSAPATVSITVAPVQDTPVAVADTYSTNEDTALTVATAGILGNDTDADGDTLTAALVTNPSHGALTLGGDGSFTYTPSADYNGPDSFTYQAGDGTATSSAATVSITVTAVNDSPVPVADAYTTGEDTPLVVAAPGVLANDTDVESPPLTAALATGPSHGALTLGSDGSFTYTPSTDYNGPDSFTYQAGDGTATSGAVTVSITVTAVNDAPVAVADTYSTNEDTPLTVAAPAVLANDTDVEGDELTTVLVSGPAHGSLTLTSHGSFAYAPSANYNGPDSFTYQASDGIAQSPAVTVSLTVVAVNDVPAPIADAYTTGEDTPLVVAAPGVLANDTDADNETLSAVKVTDPSHGTLTLGADGSFTYTPTANYNGSDSFTYKSSDGSATSSTATVTITVTSLNDTPVAVADTYTTNEDTVLNPAAPGVLSNDTDADNDTVSAVKVTDPSHGTLTLGADGSFTYTPTANYNGSDSFTYKANDGTIDSAVVTVGITVTAVNDAPAATGDSYTTNEDTALNPAAPGVLSNDTDADNDTLSAVKVTDPSHGTLTLNADGSFTYTPTANYNGSDSFTYKANDGTADSELATVSITVSSVNDAPVAVADAYTVNEDAALTVAAPGVLSNDTDADGDALKVALVTNVTHGTFSLAIDGSFTYTPTADYNGSDSFAYYADDETTTSGTTTVTITVAPMNDVPAGTVDAYTVGEDATLAAAAPGVLANDTDLDGDTLSAVKVTDPSHGTLTLGADGAVTYNPAANYNGSDSFTYKASDGTATSGIVTVTITVTSVNDAPVASNESLSTNEDAPLTVAAPGVLSNDTDADNDTLSAVKVTDPSHGTLTMNADGSFTYTPAANYNGSDSFSYKADDGTATSSAATVSITVTSLNDTPVATADTYTTAEDTALNPSAPGVLSNDTDADNDTLSAVKVTDPSHGTLTLGADGSFTYTPTANYNGSDSFTYKANDGTADSNVVTVGITVTAVNDVPSATADTYTTNEDTALNPAAPGVLSNDTDADNDTLSAVKVTDPSHGTLTLNADGSFTYTPTANYNGSDSFTYKANDGTVDSATVTVGITVSFVNDTPVAVADSYTTNEDTALNPAAPGVLSNDTDADNDTLSAVKVTDPSHGTVSLGADGAFTYTPTANYNGSDSFTYKANDGTADSSTVTVAITVTSVNDVPGAVADTYTTNEDTALNPAAPGVLSNDTDADNDTLSAVKVTDPSHGTLTLGADGSYLYTPTANYNGSDSFTYKANDGTADSSTVTVAITVTSLNDTPVATADAYTTSEDTPVTVAAAGVLTNDTDADVDTLSAVKVTDPSHGTVSLGADGAFTYTPTANYNGSDSFTYKANDGTADSSTVTVAITVSAVNDAPVASDDSTSTNEDAPVTVAAAGVLSNDTDVESSPLTAAKVTDPANGSVTVNADGSFTYTPTTDYNGSDSFTYKANDGTAESNTATVTITVNAVNDAPVAAGDAYSTNEDTGFLVAGPGVLGNDTDLETGTLSSIKVTDPSHGTVNMLTDGSFTYTPTANYNGSDSFTYKANDGTTDSNTVTVSITVNAVNDAPVAAGDSYTAVESTPLTVAAPGLLTNDTDVEASALTAAKVTDPGHGSVTVNADGSFTYTPTAAYIGPDSFTYKANDGTADSGTATVSITVNSGNVAPVAVDDSFTGAVGNTTFAAGVSGLTVPAAFQAADIKGNDTDGDGDTLSTVAGPITSTNSGSVTMNADGTFTYVPAVGFTGTDTFDYTVSDGRGGTDTGTVSVVVASMVWYVDSDAAGGGDGRSTAPFNSLTPVNGSPDADGPGETIFLYSATNPYSGGITLEASERLIGEPSGLTVGATTLLASGGAGSATVANTTGSAVTLSTGNTLNGLAIGGASGFALSGSSVGALTVANTSVANTTGGAVSIDGGALTAAFTSVSSTGSASQGIYLNNVTGSFSASGGAITGAAGSDVKVTGGTATVSYGGSVTNTAGHSVEVGSRTGGSVTLSGAVSDTGTGVLLTSNGGSTVTFSGTLTASTGTSAAFTATGGGTVAVTGSGSTLTTTTGTALKVTSTLIGASNLTFASISSDGGSNGIYLDTTGSSGGLVVTGDGGTAANGSGGTIRNMTAGADGSTNGIGIYLNSTSNVSLEAMNLSDFSNYGIRGVGVSGFSLDRSVISGSNGNNAALDEDAVSFSGLTGTASITGSTVAGGFENDFRLINASGTLNLTVDASTIGLNSTASGDDGIYVEAQSGATINPTVKNSTFSGTRGDMIQTNALAGSTMTLVFQNNTLSNGHSNIVSAGGGTTFSGAGTFNYTITGNSIQGSKGTALFVNSSGAGVFTGRIDNNTIGQAAVANSGSSEASGIRVESNSGGDQTVAINNNRVYQYNNQGIMLQAGDQQGNAVTFEVTVTNNTVSNPGSVNTGFNAIHLNAGIVGTDTFTGCIDVRTNSISGGGKGTTPPNNADLRLRQRQSTTIRLPGYGGGAFDSSAAATFEAGQNTVSTSTASIGAGGGFTGGAACSQPPS